MTGTLPLCLISYTTHIIIKRSNYCLSMFIYSMTINASVRYWNRRDNIITSLEHSQLRIIYESKWQKVCQKLSVGIQQKEPGLTENCSNVKHKLLHIAFSIYGETHTGLTLNMTIILNITYHVGFEVFTAVVMKSTTDVSEEHIASILGPKK
jgi:hypothetical protein